MEDANVISVSLAEERVPLAKIQQLEPLRHAAMM
jgi:hypothetical protein